MLRWVDEGIDWARASPLNPDFKPNSCPVLLQFAIFLSLIMLVEVAVAIAGYVFRDQVSRGQGEPVSGCSGNLGPEVCSQQHTPLLLGEVRV